MMPRFAVCNAQKAPAALDQVVWGYSTRRLMLEPVRPEAVLPVSKTSLSLSLSFSLPAFLPLPFSFAQKGREKESLRHRQPQEQLRGRRTRDALPLVPAVKLQQ